MTMMKFHYDVIHNCFEGRYNMIYSDTDYLVFNIHHENIYQWIREKGTCWHLRFCQSWLSKSLIINMVIGKFKDKTNSFANNWICSSDPKLIFFQRSQQERYGQEYDDVNKCLQTCFKKYQMAYDNYMDAMKRMSS